MKLLLASDLHGLSVAFRQFRKALKRFDAGVIAGDIGSEYVPDHRLIEMLHLNPDDLLDELPAADETVEDTVQRWKKSKQAGYLQQGLLIREQKAKDVLNLAGKPVLVVPGNHDATDWATDRNVINIHLKRFELDEVPFVGYGCIDGGLEPERQMRLLPRVRRLVDRKTILVTHIPPYNMVWSSGSRKLAGLVARRRPRYHVFGHAHSRAGAFGNFINACYPNISAFIGLDTDSGEMWAESQTADDELSWVSTPNFKVGVQEADDGGIVLFRIRLKRIGGEIVWYTEGGREILSTTMPYYGYLQSASDRVQKPGVKYKIEAGKFAEILQYSTDEVSKEDLQFVLEKIRKRDGRDV